MEGDIEMPEAGPRGTLGTVHNAALLLDLLSTGPSHHQLTDLAERSGMSLPTLHRLLRSLVAAGLVEQDERSSRYGLGPELVRLAEQYVARLPVLKVAGPYLVDLRNTTGGTVVVATLVRGEVVHVDRLDGPDAGGVFRDASRVRPALSSAAGQILLAHADEVTWRAVVARLDGAPAPDRAAWREAAYVVRPADGPADRSEVAAPVLDAEGCVVAALAVSGSAEALTAEVLEQRIAPQVVRATQAISRALGHG